VNTLVEDGSSLFVDQNYHGNALDNRKNVVYVRPVAAWQSGAWSVAAAMESNLVNNAYGYENQNGRWVDQSSRTGYGMTMSWNTLKTDAEDGAVVNLSTAYLDAADEKISAPVSMHYGIAWSWAISMRITKSTSSICPA
jgi:hypothetical protein